MSNKKEPQGVPDSAARLSELSRGLVGRAGNYGKRLGELHKREYSSWRNMRDRCYNTNNPDYQYYGGKGVTICDSWRDFQNFLADMGARPPEHSLDRYPDNNGNYEPGNCRWATQLEQNRNRCQAQEIDTPEALWTAKEAAQYLRVHPDTLLRWVRRGHFPHITLPGAGKDHRFSKALIDEWAAKRALGVR
jgi:excisionase family DNA binding protein